MKNNFQDVLKFFFTKSFFRLVPILAFGFILLLFFYAYQLELNKSDIGKKAPFSNTVGVAQTSANKNKNPLEVQNLSSRDIALMIERIVPETLSFNKESLAKRKTLSQEYFTPSGYVQYQNFLKDIGIEDAIVSQNLQSGVLMEGSPLETSAGRFNGVYKWLFEVPIALSFIPFHVETYRGQETSAYNRRMRLRIQFTRVKDIDNPDSVKIEIWQASAAQN